MTQELRFELLDIRVGDELLLAAAGNAELQLDGVHAHYQHAGGVLER